MAWCTLLLCPHAIEAHHRISSSRTTYSFDLGRLNCQGRLQARQRQQLTPNDHSKQQAPAVQHLLRAAGRAFSVPADSLGGNTQPGAGTWVTRLQWAGAKRSVGQPGSVMGVHCGLLWLTAGVLFLVDDRQEVGLGEESEQSKVTAVIRSRGAKPWKL